jgi:hypothetical protein
VVVRVGDAVASRTNGKAHMRSMTFRNSVAAACVTAAAWLLLVSPALAVTLAAAPGNDNFDNATPLTGLPVEVTGTNVDATKQASEPDIAANSGGASVWYSWTAPSSGRVALDLCGSDIDTLLGVYTGSQVDNLSEIATNDDDTGTCRVQNNQSRVIFPATAGTVYRIAVDGYSGAQGNIDLNILGQVPLTGDGVFWSNYPDNSISYANLDGSGGGDVDTTGATTAGIQGLDLEPGAGRIWWANANADVISYANLDGSGGGDLDTTGATLDSPLGVAIDLAGGKVWWANYDGDASGSPPISYASLDGSGGGNLDSVGSAQVNNPLWPAIDSSTGRIWWTNASDGTAIPSAGMGGAGDGSNLDATELGSGTPYGLSIDSDAGRIWWADTNGEGIFSTKMDGSGGDARLDVGAADLNTPGFPVLLKRATGTGDPVVTGGSAAGSTLSCSQGTWASDPTGAFLYRPTGTITRQWSRDGTDIPGATASSLSASSDGDYRCRETSTNQAGSASQTSAPHAVGASGGGGGTTITPPATSAPPTPTGQVAAALKKCNKMKAKKARGKCRRKARKLPA